MRWFEERTQTGHPGSVRCCRGTVLRLSTGGVARLACTRRSVGGGMRRTVARNELDELLDVGLGGGVGAQRGGGDGRGHLRQPWEGAMARTTRGLVVLILGRRNTHGAGEGITAVGQ